MQSSFPTLRHRTPDAEGSWFGAVRDADGLSERGQGPCLRLCPRPDDGGDLCPRDTGG